MKITSLNGQWKGRYCLPGELPVDFDATVPGCAHTDLLRAGRIPDYFQDYHTQDVQFIENAYFIYTREFVFDGDPEGMELHFDSLDTFCDIFLNGEKIGHSEDMFLPCVIPVSGPLKQGSNVLSVTFYPPAKEVAGYPPLPAAFTAERLYIRRMQCTFGWDWVDRFVTMGIIGDVTLCRPSCTELDSVYVATTQIDAQGAELYVQVDFTRVKAGTQLRLVMRGPGGEVIWKQERVIVEDTVSEWVSVESPQLWYPNGYGKQPLYRLCACVEDGDGTCLSERETVFGIRTIRVMELADAPDSEYHRKCMELKKSPHLRENDRNEEFSGFIVVVNGVKVFCKGANWVPCEPFPSDARPEKYRELLRLTAEANVNILRIWGGGLFEKDVFYEECDRLGILVTQDFLMACGQYPEDQAWFLEKLRQEAAYAAKKLRSHACLAWWTGDNENSAPGDLGMVNYPGRKAANLAIGPVIRRMDPYRRFFPSCPYGGKPFLSVTKGNAHNTFFLDWMFGVFQNSDLSDYHAFFDKTLSRFCSELPVMGAPAFSSLRRFLSPDKITDDDSLRFHTKNNPSPGFAGFGIYDAEKLFAEKLLGSFRSEEDKLFKMQYIQYEWVRITIELYRQNKWFSAGALFWMLNDCWPANGWALIDYYGNPKAGYYALKNTCRPVTASIEAAGSPANFRLHILNDSLRPSAGTARLFVQSTGSAEVLWEMTVAFDTPANQSVPVWEGHIPLPDSGAVLLCDLEMGEERYRTIYFPKRVCDLGLTGAAVQVLEQTDSRITLKADGYIHAVGLDGDYTFEDNFFPLLPGEVRSVAFRKNPDAAGDGIQIHCL